jgi:NAD(P)H-hydrate epimerase
MKHRIVTAAQMKEIEQAGDAHGLPYLQMMENAGLAAYAELQKQFPAGCWWSAERATTAAMGS